MQTLLKEALAATCESDSWGEITADFWQIAFRLRLCSAIWTLQTSVSPPLHLRDETLFWFHVHKPIDRKDILALYLFVAQLLL